MPWPRGGAVPQYRVYRMTPEGRVGGPADIITCKDDDEATARARSKLSDKDLEVWQADRRVARLKCGDREA
jgi:hypothetical protein